MMRERRAPQGIFLDVHAHIAPVMRARLARIPGVEWLAESEALRIDGHDLALKPIFRPRSLLEWMDWHGVENAWVSIPPPLYRPQLDERSARQWCAYVNDGLAEACSIAARRLKPLLHLPLEHPRLAAAIAPKASGARFAAQARDLSAPELDPLWQILDGKGAFLFIHPGTCRDPRLNAFYLENLLGNPYETGVAIAHLLFGRVRTRYPRIRFCFAHAGGVAPMVAGRFQRGLDTKRPGIAADTAPPRRVLKGVYVDCVAHDPAALALAAQTFGTNRILFGSDWPFPMGLQEPRKQLGDIGRPLQRAIFRARPRP